MDMSAMKSDLLTVLRALPKGMVNPVKVATWLAQHRKTLDTFIPMALEKMMPHIAAGGGEFAMGVLDEDDIEKTCIAALTEYGLELAAKEGVDVSSFLESLKG